MKKLYVVDASGYLYRSYFAIRNITNAKGESTNALYGFIRSILKLRKDFHPDHLVAIFDGPHSIKHRKSIYNEYKAHRAVTPSDLAYQITWAQQACSLMGIPYLAVPEVEADDAMGCVAVWAAQKDAIVYLCTSDKDLCQMVNDKIFILNTFKDNLIIGPKEVEEIHGVTPGQVVDYLSMTGDTSDNVPGLPGFGPKTAASLLKQYGTLDYILEHPEVAGKKQDTVIQFKEQALLSRRLVTIHPEVDVPKDNTFFKLREPELAPLKEFYASMNFNSLIRELEQLKHPDTTIKSEESTATTTPATYTLIETQEAFDALIKLLISHKEVGLKVVSSSESQPIKATLIGISFSVDPSQVWYVPFTDTICHALKTLFTNPNIHWYGHNIKNDAHVLANYGIEIKNISFDTMIASYLLNSHIRQHTLEQLALETFGKVLPPLSELLGKGKNALTMQDIPPTQLSLFCCPELDYICRLKSVLEKQLSERKLMPLFQNLELPLIHVLANMERHGIYLDIPYLQLMSQEINKQIADLAQEIYDMAGFNFNINSPKQVSETLFIKMGITPPKKTATGHSTNADVLESLQHKYPIAGKILEYRTLEKLRSTYIDTLPLEVYPKTQRIHCTFNQSVAATGRLSCQEPNLQNIPIRTEIGRKIRGAFRPQKEGWSYLAADYSQIELRLLAHLSEDPVLIEAFRQGKDIHTYTAANIFNIPIDQVTKEQRYGAKAVNFGIIYGQQAFGLSQELGVDVKEASLFIERYFKEFPRVKAFVEECREKVRKTGRAVTYTGRERLIPEIHNKNALIRAAAERLAINTPLQGTAADLIKMAMLQIDKRLKAEKKEGFLVLQIHDELILELPDDEILSTQNLVKDIMEGVLQLKVPLSVDIAIGKNWAAC